MINRCFICDGFVAEPDIEVPEEYQLCNDCQNEQQLSVGKSKIAGILKIVTNKQWQWVDGQFVDYFTAQHILAVWKNLSIENQIVFENMSVVKMASVAYKLIEKVQQHVH